MSCPDAASLAAYAEGKLGPEEDSRISRHIRACADCTRALRDFAARAVTAVARTLAVSNPQAPGTPAPIPERGSAIGRYLVLGVVGQGGMGLVLSAYDPELNRRVALKLVRVELDGSEVADSMRERLRREAQTMARLSHPNVAGVYDVGPYGQGVYVAMEWVEGSDLWRWQSERPRAPRAILALYLAAGEGLAAAHRAGVIHRDFKPDNVLVGADGRVRVTDFGLARQAHRDRNEKELTGPGAVVGTPGYMAPEQLRGGEVDGRADQFSFCAALYESLYGRPPFAGGNDPAVLARSVLDGKLRPPPPTPGVPKYLWPLLQRGLSPNPANRFPTIEALLAALRADPRVRRRRIALLALGVLATLSAGAGVRAALARDRRRCQTAAEAQLSSWSPARREKIATHLRASGTPEAESSAGRATAQIERYVGAWVQARTQVCEAERASGDSADLTSQAMFRHQEACLTELRRDLDEALSDLDNGELDTAPAAGSRPGPELIAHLDPPASCRSMGSTVSFEGDLDEQLWRSLAHARVLVDEDRFAEAEPQVHQLVANARAHHAGVVLARGLLLEANLSNAASRAPEVVQALFRDATRAAEAASDDVASAEARLHLYRSVSLNPPPDAQGPWRAQLDSLRADAEAAVHRAGDTLELRSLELGTEGNVDTDVGDLTQGITELEEALALIRQVTGAEMATSEILFDLAGAYLEVGDYPRAQRLYQEAVVLKRALFGPEHAEAAVAEISLAWADVLAGDPATALPLIEHGVRSFAVLHGAATNSYHAWALLNLAQVLVELGRFDEAEARLKESKAIYDAQESADPGELAGWRTASSRIEVHRGHLAEADAYLERALADLTPRRGFRRELAGTEFLLAQVLALQHGDLVRARQLAESARKRFAAATNGDQAQLAEVVAWQRLHGAP